MPDNTIRAGARTPNVDHNPRQARSDATINIQQWQDLRLWSRRLGVSVGSIKEAVGVVGKDAEAVQRYLQEADEGGGNESDAIPPSEATRSAFALFFNGCEQEYKSTTLRSSGNRDRPEREPSHAPCSQGAAQARKWPLRIP